MDVTAVVIGKLPEPGRVKTRLSPPLTPEQAAAIHDLFLRHTLEQLLEHGSSLGLERVVLCFDPPDADPGTYRRYEKLLPDIPGRIEFHRQASGNLGDRLIAAAEDLGGDRALLFLGADSPDVPVQHVAQALRRLDGHDLALGPTDDGGYWCLGVGPGVNLRPVLAEVEWSSGREREQTLNNAVAAGLSVGGVSGWFDVDHPGDLATLWERIGDDDTPHSRRLGHLLLNVLRESQRRDVLGWRPLG